MEVGSHTPQFYPTARTMLRAIVVARWLSWTWMAAIVAFDGTVQRPVLGWGAVAATLGLVVASTVLVRGRPEQLIRMPFVLTEVGFAVGLSIVDGFVFEPGHVFATTQSIATQWPLLAMATAGVALGPWRAAVLGVLIGPAEWGGALANSHSPFRVSEVVSLVATSIFFAACGVVFGWLATALARVEGEIASRRARDEVGRVMHDTVLQTLALVERRTASIDPELAAAAREADVELRAFLFGSTARTTDDLDTRVRAVVERVRRGHDTPISVSVLDDGCRLPAEHQDLVARAIGEAVANALEHARADRIVVFVETDDDGHVFASVRDDGVGFDPGAPRDGHGIDESIVGRISSIGGTVEIASGERGTEVRLRTRPA